MTIRIINGYIAAPKVVFLLGCNLYFARKSLIYQTVKENLNRTVSFWGFTTKSVNNFQYILKTTSTTIDEKRLNITVNFRTWYFMKPSSLRPAQKQFHWSRGSHCWWNDISLVVNLLEMKWRKSSVSICVSNNNI